MNNTLYFILFPFLWANFIQYRYNKEELLILYYSQHDNYSYGAPLNNIDCYDGKCTTLYYTTLQYTSLHYIVLHHHANININPHVLYSSLLTTHLLTTPLLSSPLPSSSHHSPTLITTSHSI